MNNNPDKSGGYTLVELLVGIGLFVTATSFLVAIFIQGLRSQRLLNSLLELQSNSSLIVEQVMREVRVGFDFVTPPAVSDICGDLGLADSLEFYRFVRGERIKTVYIWDETEKKLLRSIEDGLGNIQESQINANNISLNRLCFLVNPANGEPRTNPWRITISAAAGLANSQAPNKVINFQTSIAARVLPSEVPPLPITP